MGFSTAVATGDGGVDKCGVMHRVFHSLYTCFRGLCTGADLHAGAFPAQNRGAQWLCSWGQDSQSEGARLTILGGKVDYIGG